MDARIDSGHIGSPGRDSNDEAWILILAACFLFFFLVRAGGSTLSTRLICFCFFFGVSVSLRWEVLKISFKVSIQECTDAWKLYSQSQRWYIRSTFDANNFFIPGISEESKTSHYSQLKLSKHFQYQKLSHGNLWIPTPLSQEVPKTTTEFLGGGDVTAPTSLVSRLKLPKAKKSPRTKEKERGGVIPRPVVTAMEHSPREAVEVDSSWLVSWYFVFDLGGWFQKVTVNQKLETSFFKLFYWISFSNCQTGSVDFLFILGMISKPFRAGNFTMVNVGKKTFMWIPWYWYIHIYIYIYMYNYIHIFRLEIHQKR